LDAVESLRAQRKANITEMAFLRIYGLCPAGFITPLSAEAWHLYNVLAGTTKCQSPDQLYGLSNLYVEACRIIESELAETGA
jgi:hypothetical protein